MPKTFSNDNVIISNSTWLHLYCYMIYMVVKMSKIIYRPVLRDTLELV